MHKAFTVDDLLQWVKTHEASEIILNASSENNPFDNWEVAMRKEHGDVDIEQWLESAASLWYEGLAEQVGDLLVSMYGESGKVSAANLHYAIRRALGAPDESFVRVKRIPGEIVLYCFVCHSKWDKSYPGGGSPDEYVEGSPCPDCLTPLISASVTPITALQIRGYNE